MKKKTGFCMQRDEHGFVGAAVSSTGDGWQIDELSQAAPDGEPSATLRAAMSQANLPITWLLADGESGMSHLTMPKLRPKALKMAFRGGLAREHGGKPDDWYLDWSALPLSDSAKAQGNLPYVLHHAAREIVDEKTSSAQGWGVTLERMLPAHLALDLFYRAFGPEPGENSVWNLVFIGQNQRFLCVATEDAQLVIRNLPANLSTDDDDQEYLTRLVTEIERSAFFARQTEHSPEVKKIIVCGNAEIGTPLTAMLSESSDVPAIYWSIQDMFDWGQIQANADDLLVLAGAAMAMQKVPYNLLPGKSVFNLSRSLRRQLVVGVAACAAAAVPLLVVGGLVTSRVQGTYLERAQMQLTEAQERASRAEVAYNAQNLLMARENHIRNFARTRPDFEEGLLRLAALTPGEVVFSNLQVREQLNGYFRLRLEGESQAATGEKAQGAFLSFLAALDDCDFLRRLGDPQVMQIIPGDEKNKKTTTRKTTVFHLELIWRHNEPGDG